MLGPKVAIWRSEKYRRYISQQKCFGCSIEGYSQCAHPNMNKGLSLKTGDDLAFPLCSVRPGHMGCHQILDLRLDGLSREQHREIERGYTQRMQAIALADGWALPGMKEAA